MVFILVSRIVYQTVETFCITSLWIRCKFSFICGWCLPCKHLAIYIAPADFRCYLVPRHYLPVEAEGSTLEEVAVNYELSVADCVAAGWDGEFLGSYEIVVSQLIVNRTLDRLVGFTKITQIMSTDFLIHAVHISLSCFGFFITLISKRICYRLDSGILYTVKFEGSINIIRIFVLFVCCILIVFSSCIILFIREDIAFFREGVSIYFNSCYLHISGHGFFTSLTGEIEVKLGNGANQRNRNTFVLCLNLCISYVLGYCYVGNGTGNRETLAWNLCSLSLAFFCNAEWIIEGYILQFFSGNAAEILAIQLLSHIGTL